MTIAIRIAEKSDLGGLLMLYGQLNPADPQVPHPVAAPILTDMLARPGLFVLVAEISGTLAGSVTLVIIPNLTRGGASYALVENVVTHDGYRRRGIGRALLAAAARRAEAAGCYKLMLMTSRPEPHVRAFYMDCGFRQDKIGFQMRFGGR